jgi:hypothetical protein
MKMLDYIDTEKATVAALKDWNSQRFKFDSYKEKTLDIKYQMERTKGQSFTAPIKGGGSRQEERLAALIDKKDVLEHGYNVAKSYLQEIEGPWALLSEEDQYMLTARFVDYEEGDGIKRIMERFFIGKSEAYTRSNAALKKLSKLLFW